MPTPTNQPLVAPTLAETQAVNSAGLDEAIRELATQLQSSGALGYTPSTHVKGVITAVNYAGLPPTVTIQIQGETSVEISGVRIMNNYTPVVGQTVDIRKQGPDIVITGHTADVSGTALGQTGSGWIKAVLSNGSHNANANGDVYYRLVLDHGSWKMQWRGGWDPDGASVMIDTAEALATDYRPKSHRSVAAARQVSNATSAVWDFHTDGRVVLTGHTYSTSSSTVSGDVGFTNISSFTSVGGTHNHLGDSGGVTSSDGGHDHSVGASHDHGFSGGAHSHTATAPSWVSLNGVEYFL